VEKLTTVHYLPIITTIMSLIFGTIMVLAAKNRKTGPHLLWWAFGIFCYGLGTGLESAITLTGNTVALNKAWYIAGALLGGWPLAQGAVYLHMKRRKANVMAYITTAFVLIAAICVIASPVIAGALEVHRPSGAILGWKWVRLMTPFINVYALIFLVGGAVMSAIYYKKVKDTTARVWGNVFIAFGGLLPGIGGSMAKANMVEALYVLELAGLVFIWIGYGVMVRANADRRVAVSPTSAAQPSEPETQSSTA
jgi:hypothetical protein